MGGPCLCNGKAVTPGTDNFEIAPFELQGIKYYSAEQAYQAAKMRKDADRAKVARCVPKPGERAWDYGMRAWQAGQLGAARKDWEAVKVEAMYVVNRRKLEQNPALLASLLESNGAPRGMVTHRGSGRFWDKWNPVILTLLREELSPAGDGATVEALRGEMEVAAGRVLAGRDGAGGRHGHWSLAAHALGRGGSAGSCSWRGECAAGLQVARQGRQWDCGQGRLPGHAAEARSQLDRSARTGSWSLWT